MKQTRREFLGDSMVLGLAAGICTVSADAGHKMPSDRRDQPWYRRTLRWGQTNITEADPAAYDIAWWREYWRRTRVQGVIINAGGIVAYYPSRFPLHYRPPALGERDLFGELIRAAHEDGLAVLARMDSNRAHEDFHQAHPEWFAVDRAGKPYRAGDLYVACVNSPYYDEYIPALLREIAERYHPEGFTDNSWSGPGRGSICYCGNCRTRFAERTGHSLPETKDWDSPVYRDWILWNYARRLEIWDQNNRATRAAGGPECLWAGMNGGSLAGQCQSFRDYKEICARAEIIMLDHQARSEAGGFHQNGETGKLIHGLLGWDKLIPESMAMYQAGRPTFRKASKPEPEARLWMLEGFAGGIQPWWHHVGARQEDLRQFRTSEPVNRWHAANEQYLVDRRPVATVGLVWSQRNADFYGRDNANELVELPLRGWSNALVQDRIPYLPVHADHVGRDGPDLDVLILPNLAAISEEQIAAVRRFVERGGSLIATGRTSLYSEWGQARADFALADLFGAHRVGSARPSIEADRKQASETLHTYVRLFPEVNRRSLEMHAARPAAATASRHPVLRGFDETDILPFGGALEDVAAADGAEVLMSFVPPFPIYPPETSWMREPRTNIPALIVGRSASGGRLAFLPADLDRRYAVDTLPDHGRALANLVRWAARDSLPLQVDGPGFVDCHLYRQANRLVLHLVNLTNAGSWRAAVHELIPVGPLKIRVTLPEGLEARAARLLVSGATRPASRRGRRVQFSVDSLLDHEVIVLQ